MGACLQIALLGEVQIRKGGQPLAGLRAPKLQGLLAYLILNGDVVIPRDRLAFELWPESSEAHARGSLRKAIYQLRKQLPSAETCLNFGRRDLLWHRNAPAEVDVYRLEKSLTRPLTHEAISHLLELYRGDLLISFYDEWIEGHQRRLRSAVEDYLQQGANYLRHTEDWPLAKTCLHRLLDMDPLREESYHQLMQVYLKLGDRNRALWIYDLCRQRLADELGVEPGQALQAFYHHLKNDGQSLNRPPEDLAKAHALAQAGQFDDAYQIYLDAAKKGDAPRTLEVLAYAERLPSQSYPHQRMALLNLRAEAHAQSNQLGRAQRDLAELADLALVSENEPLLVETKYRQALTAYHAGDLRSADMLASGAVDLAQDLSRPILEAKAQRILALTQARLTLNYSATIDALGDALTLAQGAEDIGLAADILCDHAPVYHLMGQPQKAFESSQAALVLAEQHTLPWQGARARLRLTVSYTRDGQYEKSLAVGDAVRAHFPEADYPHIGGYLNLSHTHAHWALGAYDRARQSAIQAHQQSLAVGDRALEYESQREYAYILQNLGQWEKAQWVGTQALNLARRRNIGPAIAEQYTFLAEFAAQRGDDAAAQSHLKRAERFLRYTSEHKELQGRIHKAQAWVHLHGHRLHLIERALDGAEQAFEEIGFFSAYWQIKLLRSHYHFTRGALDLALKGVNALLKTLEIRPIGLAAPYAPHALRYEIQRAQGQAQKSDRERAREIIASMMLNLDEAETGAFKSIPALQTLYQPLSEVH